MAPIVVGEVLPLAPEQLVLDAEDIAVGRTSLDIGYDAIRVRVEGPDWGDAEFAGYMAEMERGEAPVDGRLPNRKVTIPLLIRSDGSDYSFDDARKALQSKVALFQREGGWLKRELNNGAKVYLDIVNATLGLGGHTFQALGRFDNEAELILETLPDWYGEEIDLGTFTETTHPELIALLGTDILGDLPGRVRIVVNEDDGETQLGLIGAFRSRHYSDESTAALAYPAAGLDPLDSAAIDGDYIEHNDLSTNWTPVLSTGFLGHTGSYRVWAQTESVDGENVRARLVWDVGDFIYPSENAPVTVPGTAGLYLLDLGEVRLDEVHVGTHRWQGQIQAEGSVGGEEIRVKRLWFQPLDEFAWKLAAPVSVAVGLSDYLARDEFNQTAGTLATKALPVGGTWTEAGASGAFSVDATDHVLRRTQVGSENPHFALAGTSTPTVVVVQADVRATSEYGSRRGVLTRYVDTSNFVRAAYFHDDAGVDNFGVEWYVAGVNSTVLVPVTELGTEWKTIRLAVLADGHFLAWFGNRGASLGEPLVTGYSVDLATAGALASGKVGLVDQNNTNQATSKDWDNFTAWVPNPDAVLHPNQSAELHTNGCFRQTADGTGWGPTRPLVGNLPRIPPSGLEERQVELFLKASRGDLDELPDSGVDDLSCQVFYRPSFLFIPSEAPGP